MHKIAIIGYGRFGELLARLASPKFSVSIVESDPAHAKQAETAGYSVIPLSDVADVDFVFLAVPISAIEATVRQLAPIVRKGQVIIDLCSVKVHPITIMQKYLADSGCQILGSHPMFGPDSAKSGLTGLQVALCPINVEPANLETIKAFWTDQDVDVIETTPEAHDHDAVYSLAFTHTVAHIIYGMDLPDITFRTRSFEAITQVAALSKNDTEQLFHDMLYYNPYFPDMKRRLEATMTQTASLLDAIAAERGDADGATDSPV